jgi:hypothetical protein
MLRTHVVAILEGIDLAEGDLMKYPSISFRAIAADPAERTRDN